jgi:hypothetical protein
MAFLLPPNERLRGVVALAALKGTKPSANRFLFLSLSYHLLLIYQTIIAQN